MKTEISLDPDEIANDFLRELALRGRGAPVQELIPLDEIAEAMIELAPEDAIARLKKLLNNGQLKDEGYSTMLVSELLMSMGDAPDDWWSLLMEDDFLNDAYYNG